MSDLSASKDTVDSAPQDAPTQSPWLILRKLGARLSDWFSVQSLAIQVMVVAVAILIPLTAGYSYTVMQRQATVAEQVKVMAGQAGADAPWVLNDKLPVVFGSGSVLGFLEA